MPVSQPSTSPSPMANSDADTPFVGPPKILLKKMRSKMLSSSPAIVCLVPSVGTTADDDAASAGKTVVKRKGDAEEASRRTRLRFEGKDPPTARKVLSFNESAKATVDDNASQIGSDRNSKGLDALWSAVKVLESQDTASPLLAKEELNKTPSILRRSSKGGAENRQKRTFSFDALTSLASSFPSSPSFSPKASSPSPNRSGRRAATPPSVSGRGTPPSFFECDAEVEKESDAMSEVKAEVCDESPAETTGQSSELQSKRTSSLFETEKDCALADPDFHDQEAEEVEPVLGQPERNSSEEKSIKKRQRKSGQKKTKVSKKSRIEEGKWVHAPFAEGPAVEVQEKLKKLKAEREGEMEPLFEFIGNPTRKDRDGVHYEAVSKDDTVFEVGDCVELMAPDGGEPLIGRIVDLYDASVRVGQQTACHNDNGVDESSGKMKVQWYYTIRELKKKQREKMEALSREFASGTSIPPSFVVRSEVLYSEDVEENDIESIDAKCLVFDITKKQHEQEMLEVLQELSSLLASPAEAAEYQNCRVHFARRSYNISTLQVGGLLRDSKKSSAAAPKNKVARDSLVSEMQEKTRGLVRETVEDIRRRVEEETRAFAQEENAKEKEKKDFSTAEEREYYNRPTEVTTSRVGREYQADLPDFIGDSSTSLPSVSSTEAVAAAAAVERSSAPSFTSYRRTDRLIWTPKKISPKDMDEVVELGRALIPRLRETDLMQIVRESGFRKEAAKMRLYELAHIDETPLSSLEWHGTTYRPGDFVLMQPPSHSGAKHPKKGKQKFKHPPFASASGSLSSFSLSSPTAERAGAENGSSSKSRQLTAPSNEGSAKIVWISAIRKKASERRGVPKRRREATEGEEDVISIDAAVFMPTRDLPQRVRSQYTVGKSEFEVLFTTDVEEFRPTDIIQKCYVVHQREFSTMRERLGIAPRSLRGRGASGRGQADETEREAPEELPEGPLYFFRRQYSLREGTVTPLRDLPDPTNLVL